MIETKTTKFMAHLRFRGALFALVLCLAGVAARAGAADLRVVTTLTVYRDIAKEILGDRGSVKAIAAARQDAHFVQPKPSYSVMLQRADLLVSTGLDLEMWLPPVIDKSKNPRIREGEIGYVSVATGVPMLQVPANPSRAAGDIHLFGNPHIHTDPLRAAIVAENIKIGLQRVDPDHGAEYETRYQDFKKRIYEHLFGAELVRLVGGDKLAELTMKHELRAFLDATQLGGKPLSSRLGGWLKRGACLRGTKIVPYHLNWIYFLDRFGVLPAAYVERRPGIPPSASHVAELITLIRRDKIPVLWVADYYDERVPKLVAERTGATFLYVPTYTGEGESSKDYFTLIDTWIDTMTSAIDGCQGD